MARFKYRCDVLFQYEIGLYIEYFLDKQELITACETCVKGGDIVLPRTEIMEQSMVCLLNLNDWDVINCVEKRWGNFEIAIAIMSACQDLSKSKGNKKVLKDLWDLGK